MKKIGDSVQFSFGISLSDLLAIDAENLNDWAQKQFEEQFESELYLDGISIRPTGVDGMDDISMEVNAVLVGDRDD